MPVSLTSLAHFWMSSRMKRSNSPGAMPMGTAPGEFERFMREDIQKWGKLVRETGMKVD